METPEPIAKKLAQLIITSGKRPLCQILCKSAHGGASRQMREI